MKTIARKNWVESQTGGAKVVHKNDIYLDNGDFGYCYDKDAHAQVIEAVLKTVKGELQLDAYRGIPYFSTVFNNSRSADIWEIAVRQEVSNLYFVEQIESFTYAYDFTKKKLGFTLVVKTTDDETITISE